MSAGPMEAHRLLPGLGRQEAAAAPAAFPNRELALQLVPLLVALVLLVGLNIGGSWLMNGARGYVAGESTWSKAQKDATAYLHRFAETNDPLAFDNFRDQLRIIHGDRRARLALLGPAPDRAAAHEGFRQGGNDEADIPAMVWILEHLRWQPAIARAVAAWEQGDARIAELEAVAGELRSAPADGGVRGELAASRAVVQLRRLDGELTSLEHAFSQAVGEASRQLAAALEVANLVLGALLLAFGTLQARRMILRRRRAEWVEERALRDAERREQAFLQAMVEGVDVGVMVSDRDRVVYSNSAFCQLLGLRRPDELAGVALERLMPERERTLDLINRDKAAAGTVVPLRVGRWLRPDGSEVKVVANLSMVDWLGAPHYITTASALADHTVLETQLRSLSDRFERAMVSELENQQAAIARELHDSLGSVLAGISLLLGHARSVAGESPAGPLIERTQGELKTAAEMTRAMARGIMPVGSHAGALTHALEQFASDLGQLKGLACHVESQGDFSDIPAGMGNHIFRIVQEATTNAVKHGNAGEVAILLAEAAGSYAITITDNGSGFDVESIPSSHAGLGLKSMHARARSIGATLRVQRGRDRGCRVTLSWSRRAAMESDRGFGG